MIFELVREDNVSFFMESENLEEVENKFEINILESRIYNPDQGFSLFSVNEKTSGREKKLKEFSSFNDEPKSVQKELENKLNPFGALKDLFTSGLLSGNRALPY